MEAHRIAQREQAVEQREGVWAAGHRDDEPGAVGKTAPSKGVPNVAVHRRNSFAFASSRVVHVSLTTSLLDGVHGAGATEGGGSRCAVSLSEATVH